MSDLSTLRLPRLAADYEAVGGDGVASILPPDAVGLTMFDHPGSEDGSVTVLLGKDRAQGAPAQALVRIESRCDGRTYLGVVTAGPFIEPDSLRADSNILIAIATRGTNYLPQFHGRV